MVTRWALVLLAVAATAAGCSSGYRPAPEVGVAVGRMHLTGGFFGDRDQSAPGKIDVFRVTNFVTYPDHSWGFNAAPVKTVMTSANGSFRISLDPGTYRVRGAPTRSSYLVNSEPFTISPGHTATVKLIFDGF